MMISYFYYDELSEVPDDLYERILDRIKMQNPIRFRKLPIEIEAIQWNANEPFIRRFVGDDTLLRFPDGGNCSVFNTEEQDWIKVPHKHYIAKGVKGELYPISPEILARTYEALEDKGLRGFNSK